MTAWDVFRTLASRLGCFVDSAAAFGAHIADKEAASACGSKPGGNLKLNIGESVAFPI